MDDFGDDERLGNHYERLNISGEAKVHLGNAYYNTDDTRARFVQSLYSPWLDERRHNVKTAAPKTFEWVFDPERGALRKWDNFVAWLRSGTSTYWIQGKPGSGKSTLMAYIVDDERTLDHLKIWCQGEADNHLHVLSFFFWRAGDVLQKSITGLLRGLLYQIALALSQRQVIELINESDVSTNTAINWTERGLLRVIKKAIAINPNSHFAIFVDGLDEYVGDYDDLIDLIVSVQELKNVKCCVSSRPEALLVNRLGSFNQLRLQDLNYRDIRSFAAEKFGRTSMSDRQQADFSADVSKKAEGVFLWAVLVTRSLVKGWASGDDHDMLLHRLHSAPSEMANLFAQMLSSVDEVHRKSLAFYLQCMHLKEMDGLWSPSICELAIVRLKGQFTTYAELQRACSQTEMQIETHSAGILMTGPLIAAKTGVPVDKQEWRRASVRFHVPALDESSASTSQERLCRQVADASLPFPRLLRYENRTLQWIHRSAYDYFFGTSKSPPAIFNLQANTQMVQDQLLDASLKYLASAPSICRSDKYERRLSGSTSLRLARAMLRINLVASDDPRRAFHILDRLKSAMEGFRDPVEFIQRGLVFTDIYDPRNKIPAGCIAFWDAYCESFQPLDALGYLQKVTDQPGSSLIYAYLMSITYDFDNHHRPQFILTSESSVTIQFINSLLGRILDDITSDSITTQSRRRRLFVLKRDTIGTRPNTISYRTSIALSDGTEDHDSRREALTLVKVVECYFVWCGRYCANEDGFVAADAHAVARDIFNMFHAIFRHMAVRTELPIDHCHGGWGWKRMSIQIPPWRAFSSIPRLRLPGGLAWPDTAEDHRIRLVFARPTELDGSHPHEMLDAAGFLDLSSKTSHVFRNVLDGSTGPRCRFRGTRAQFAELRQMIVHEIRQSSSKLTREQQVFAEQSFVAEYTRWMDITDIGDLPTYADRDFRREKASTRRDSSSSSTEVVVGLR